MVFCGCNVTNAMRSTWSPLAAPTVGALGEPRGFSPSCGARRMAESAALLVDEVLPHEPMRQWVLSVPFPLRLLFASQPKIMGKALGIVYHTIATHLTRKAGFTKTTAHTGAVTLIQRFGGALNLNIHLMCMDARMPRAQGCAGAAHMLFLDGVYMDSAGSSTRFCRVKAPTNSELNQLSHTIARRLARYLERQGLLERDAENSYLALDHSGEDPMDQLRGHSITSATAPALRYLLHPCSRIVSRWGLNKGARYSRCKHCPGLTSPAMVVRVRQLVFHCMLA